MISLTVQEHSGFYLEEHDGLDCRSVVLCPGVTCQLKEGTIKVVCCNNDLPHPACLLDSSFSLRFCTLKNSLLF